MKWLGVAVLIGLVAAWCASLRWYVRYVSYSASVGICRSQIICARYIGAPSDRKKFIERYAKDRPGWHATIEYQSVRWSSIGRALEELGLMLPSRMPMGPVKYGSVTVAHDIYTMPLWIPTSLVTALTVTLFVQARQRARKGGHCTKCAYDLRGNTSGICPECGTPVTDTSQGKRAAT
jgi:hypothetical protein